MSATQKFFRRLFGADGDRAAVPDDTPTDGSVNYDTGYGFDYQRAASDGLRKPIERTKLNQILYDITLGLRQYQTHGFPEFIQAADNNGAAFAYDKNAFVLWTDGQVYQSLVAANTSDPSNVSAWQLAILGTGIGVVQFFPATTAPVGYLKANGALLNRAAYPALWAYAQASNNLAVSDGAWQRGQFSPGDGASTFRIPDVRGQHVRGFDDGAGIDSGRVLGSTQADQLPSHTHGAATSTSTTTSLDVQGAHQHTTNIPVKPNGTGAGPYAMVDGFNGLAGYQGTATDVQGAHSHNATSSSASSTTVFAAGAGTETRVKNVALLGCIKYL